jgi:hypothetical protein
LYTEEAERYKHCMEEIVRRQNAIKAFLSNMPAYLPKLFSIEFICHQFRSVIELIFLSSLAAHKKQYTKGFEKLSQEWHIKSIIDFLKSVNPDYLPMPVDIHADPSTGNLNRLVNNNSKRLEKEELIAIYDICKKYCHPQNPFAETKNLQEVIELFEPWWYKLNHLLEFHVIKLQTSDRYFWVRIDFRKADSVQII